MHRFPPVSSSPARSRSRAGPPRRRRHVLVVNAANPAASVRSRVLAHLPESRDVVARSAVATVDLRIRATARRVLARRDGSPRRRRSFWQQQIFAARTCRGREGSDAEVLAFVRANPGAVATSRRPTWAGGRPSPSRIPLPRCAGPHRPAPCRGTALDRLSLMQLIPAQDHGRRARRLGAAVCSPSDRPRPPERWRAGLIGRLLPLIG